MNVAGSTGRSKVTEMVTVPLAASASGIGPIVLVMIRGPAAMTIGRYQMFERIAVDDVGAVIVEALVEVARPDRIDLAVEDGQAHLVAVAEAGVALGRSSGPDWLSAIGPRMSVWPVIASTAVLEGLA